MSIKAGLVGLPNVGKSTLFNALTKSSVPSENYPFCTIDPHLAITEVPDSRLDKLAGIFGSGKKIPATVSFVDIAGLVKGAASGEGLGNQFLSHIREVDLILHVVRCFEGSDIIRSTNVDPLDDFEIIVSELMLKDYESVEKRLQRLELLIKSARNKPAELQELEQEQATLIEVKQSLNAGDAEKVRSLLRATPLPHLPLLTAKDFLLIANVAEADLEHDAYKNNKHYQALVSRFSMERVIPVSARLEYELSQLNDEEAQEMMNLLSIKARGVENIIRQTYKHLGLITFFTCGPKEAHAWPIKKGITVRKAAGEIHSDLDRGFICAEVYNCKDIFECGSESKLRSTGKIRIEGQEYIVNDGDLLNIRFNV